MIDFIACERHFVDHAAPVWHAMPGQDRGRFLVDASLVERAARLGIAAESIDAEGLRQSSRPPGAKPGSGPLAFVVSIGDTKIGRRLGYRRFAFMEHGAGQSYIGDPHAAINPSYAGGIDREDTDLFLVPNEYSARLWRAAYPKATVEVVGCPRLDTLPPLQIDPIEAHPVVAFSFHWPAYVCPEASTAFGHYARVLPEIAQRFHVIGHRHPNWVYRHYGDHPGKAYRQAGIEVVDDFDDVCRRADVYVCDNSSTLFEFASTGRPVVVLNSPQYRRDVHHGLRFWEAAHVGINVWDSARLGDAIAEALVDAPPQQANREDALSVVYSVRTNGAAHAAAALSQWVGSAVPRAA